jgi:hypothetical protein
MKKEPNPAAGSRDTRSPAELPRCFSCDRVLKDSAEWVRSAQKTMCMDCYEGLIDPFPKFCHSGLLV